MVLTAEGKHIDGGAATSGTLQVCKKEVGLRGIEQ